MKEVRYLSQSPEDTRAIAAQIAAEAESGWVIALEGDLGANAYIEVPTGPNRLVDSINRAEGSGDTLIRVDETRKGPSRHCLA